MANSKDCRVATGVRPKTPKIIRFVAFSLAVIVATPACADVVTDWNTVALNAIRLRRTLPPIASRALAILHISIYDAVNGISRTHEAYFVPSAVRASASKIAAANAAAHQALVALFPMDASTFDSLYTATLAGIPDSPQKQAGVEWGQFVAQQILAARANDGANATLAPPGGAGPGIWEPTPAAFAPYALPQWGRVTPFVMSSSAQVRPLGPPALNTPKYAQDYNEVKLYGAAVGSLRSAEQDQIALFWADGAGTETPPGHWNSIAQDVGTMLGSTLEENARLFALMNAAMADAAICAWDAKYEYHFWRPVTAIQRGDTDGNAATAPDSGWAPFITTPPFPDYVSGHSTFSGAASTVLAMFYGEDHISFTTGSDFLPSVTRSFTSFSAAAAEAALSRLYGGIHFRFANEDGLTAGIAIGEWAFTRFMQPKGNRSRK